MFKKTFLLILILCLFPVGMGYGEESFPFLAEITSENVNLRSGQSENFERLLQLKKGQEVVVVERSYGWYKVRLPETATLYVSAEYISPAGATVGVVKADRVNVRAGKGVQFTVLGQLSAGDKVDIKEKTKDWYGIAPLSHLFGWVSDQYVAFKSTDVPVILARKSPQVKQRQEPLVEPVVEPVASEIPLPQVPVKEEVNAPSVKPDVMTVTGRLEPLSGKESVSGIDYKLVTDDGKIYYLQAQKALLDSFRKLKVSIQGKVKPDPASRLQHPVIVISRINLII